MHFLCRLWEKSVESCGTDLNCFKLNKYNSFIQNNMQTTWNINSYVKGQEYVQLLNAI